MDYLVNLTIYELLSTNVWENAPNLYVYFVNSSEKVMNGNTCLSFF